MLDGVDAIARFAMSTFGIFQGTTVTYARVHAIIYRHEGVEVLRCKCEGVMKSASDLLPLAPPRTREPFNNSSSGEVVEGVDIFTGGGIGQVAIMSATVPNT